MLGRHIDNGVYLSSFIYLDQWVKCPKCNQPSLLKYHKPQAPEKNRYQGTFFLSCLNCAYQINPNQNHDTPQLHNGHYEATTYQRCQKCGGVWLRAKQKLLNVGSLPPFIRARCRLCQHISKFEQYGLNFILDQNIGYTFYGLELYLKTQTQHGVISVYNIEHLKELKTFIQAGLRERTSQTGNGSYFSRLPAWIKSTRNRKEILKAILRLEEMASTIQPLTK
ncbi:hypothetical protein [Acinetobacter beijerinckii]|uniref:Uncharacterized protein n=1 Tax=Acinetobacter beijerinckii CIP 110307 TaxID=1217648 RepID=N9FFM1_9GAMM|nr:hypothetical protein [Acinetobacter beijerinckii]ENW03669.1 hypothetical protein F933_03069 [Acinetobacter beijerinckii CIP 110307]